MRRGAGSGDPSPAQAHRADSADSGSAGAAGTSGRSGARSAAGPLADELRGACVVAGYPAMVDAMNSRRSFLAAIMGAIAAPAVAKAVPEAPAGMGDFLQPGDIVPFYIH